MIIREHKPGDINTIKQYLVELQDYERKYDCHLVDGKTAVNELLKHLIKNCDSQCGKIYVAEENNIVIGFIAVQAKVKSEDIHDKPYL